MCVARFKVGASRGGTTAPISVTYPCTEEIMSVLKAQHARASHKPRPPVAFTLLLR